MLDVDITLSRDRFPIRAQFRLNQKAAGLFGPSGAGKSRLLTCLAGHCPPDRGYVSLGGEVLFDSRKRVNRLSEDGLIALCSQDSSLDATRTVRENLLRGIARVKAHRPYFALPDIVQLLLREHVLRQLATQRHCFATQPVKGISIQNQIKGKVCAVIPREDRVVIQIDVGTTLIAEITRRALAATNICEGDTVYCLAKTQAFNFLAADMISDCSAAALQLFRTAESDGLNGHSFRDVGGIGKHSRHNRMQRWSAKDLRKL